MAEIADHAAFVAVVDHGSLTAAARHLDRSLQAVSRSLAALENELGVTLVQRTTRRSRPTEAGLAFLARIRPVLAEIARACDEAKDQATRISGRIRVAGPALFGVAHLTPLVASFMQRHPDIDVDLILGEAYADLAGDGFDLALRFGEMADSSLKARRLGSLRQVVFGTPGYFAANGWPRTPDDLARHRCIIRSSAQDAESWPFRRDGRPSEVRVSGPFRSNNPAACNAAAAQWLGIARAPLWQVREAIDAGRLVIVLGEDELDAMPVHLVWPPTPLPRRVRLLIDHIAGLIDLSRA